MKKVTALLIMVFLMMAPLLGFADDPSAAAPAVEAATSAADASLATGDEQDIGGLLEGVVKAIGDWKKIGWQAGLAALLMVLLGTMKNSLLRSWIWDKIPQWSKVLVAPLISLLIFFLGMQEFTWQTVMAALTTGAAAVYLHQIVKALGDAPFVGGWVKTVLDFIGSMLGKPEKKEA